jgi:predicted RNase H-like HicB family nuclease
MSQGRTREEARDNVLDALRTVLAPDEELSSEALQRGELVERRK